MEAGVLIGFAIGMIVGAAIGGGLARAATWPPGNARGARGGAPGLALEALYGGADAALEQPPGRFGGGAGVARPQAKAMPRRASSLAPPANGDPLPPGGGEPRSTGLALPTNAGTLARPDTPVLEKSGRAGGDPALDLDALTEGLWADLHASVERQVIRQVLEEIALRYRDARIVTFVPILVRREALGMLRERSG